MSTTKTTDRTPAADLAARLRERAAEYEAACREKLRAESALLAAMSNYERARYLFDRDVRQWCDRLARWEQVGEGPICGSHGGCIVRVDLETGASKPLCGAAWQLDSDAPPPNSRANLATCPACLAALDEVQP